MVLNRSPDLIEVTVFNVLTICIQGKQALPPRGNIYQRIVKISTILLEGHQRNICAKIFYNLFVQEDFLKFHYRYIYKKMKLHPCRPFFSW